MTRKLTYVLLALVAGAIPSFAQVSAGVIEGPDTDLQQPQLIGQSFMGSIGKVGGVPNAPTNAVQWWNLINIRHRNGGEDGNAYGGQMLWGMTAMPDRLFFRTQTAGAWTGWQEAFTPSTPRVLINNAVDDGSTQLQVNGASRATVAVAAKEGSAGISSQFYLMNPSGSRAFNLQLTEGDFPGLAFWRFNGNWYEAMRIASDGNISIGATDAKGYKLAVAGSMIAEKIKVKLSGAWPDYVFDKKYELPALDTLETFIRSNKHLPGMAPAAEVRQNGLDVAEMQRLQMQKIEELTLYVIELNKKIQEQQKEIKQLKEEKIKGL